MPASNSRYLPWLLLYVLLIAYSSTLIGPLGIHFVPISLDEAAATFAQRLVVWVDNGSDQRADWMANLSMCVPLGFLLGGTLRFLRPRVLGLATALGLAIAFVLSVKFAQLFFPPRTVTLNYIVAQSTGSAIGILAYALARTRLIKRAHTNGREALRLWLKLYTAALCLFFLMPLDFALDAADLLAQLDRLPAIVTRLPGEGRPLLIQAILVLAGTLATAPIGMLLVVGPRGRNRFLSAIVLRGFIGMLVILALSALLLSGAPTLIAVFYRTFGIALGGWSMRWLARQDLNQQRTRLAQLVPWALLPFLGLLLAVNGLLSPAWRSPAEAIETLSPHGLIPLYDYYIVTKAEAAKNIIGHAIMYAPIGVFVWLRGYPNKLALLTALPLAACVEAARYLRPGLEGDVNAIAVAGLSAFVAARLLPGFWHMLEGVARPQISLAPVAVPSWRERAAAATLQQTARSADTAAGEIEHF